MFFFFMFKFNFFNKFTFKKSCMIMLCTFFFFLVVYLYLFYKAFLFEKFNFFKLNFFFEKANLFIFCFCFFFFCTVFSFCFRNYLALYGIFFLNIFSNFLFWFFMFYNMDFFVFENNKLIFYFFKWFYINSEITIFFDIYIDLISYSFAFLTLTISFFVNIYIFAYFRYEPFINRLIFLINLFVLSMVLLVCAGNLFTFFLGWELIGLTSFYLINFWNNRVSTLKSAFKALFFNKYSDFCFFFAIIIIFFLFNDVTFSKILDLNLLKNEILVNKNYSLLLLNILCFFLLSAAFIKSAQVGFHIWLPESMEAPVPASALIHSATLVSAGIFLILRFYFILELSFFFNCLCLVGSITAFLGGCIATSQTDLKKILAYSTISHCGFLVFLCGLHNINYVLIYLYIHGFFKAISFLCAGNIIRFSNNYQDLRRMGDFFKYLSADFFFLVVSLFNLSGLPFFFGFYIKHFLFLSSDFNQLKQVYLSFLFLACLTGIFYSFKIIFFIFFDFKKSRKYEFLYNEEAEHKSIYFSNTTLASSYSIFFLIIVSYIICFFFFYFLILKEINVLDFYSYFGKFQLFFFFNEDLSCLYNYSIFYWVSLVLITILILVTVVNFIVRTFFLEFFFFFDGPFF